jgi:Fe-Mn family superoxide dismutase
MHLRRFSRGLLGRFADTKAPAKATLPNLNYDYSELEPVISKAQLELHHKKHHQTYVNNLNAALEQFQEAQAHHDYNKMGELADKIKFNLGGHINHSIYW